MTRQYLQAVNRHLGRLSAKDRKHAIEALGAQLAELADAGVDPVTALGEPANYADRLSDALSGEAPDTSAQWRILGLPVDTRGPVSAKVRSRTWDPTNPTLLVPRLFGIGWTLNLGALAVKLGLIRADDSSDDVLASIPEGHLRRAQLAPLVVAGATAGMLAASWRCLPSTVASGFGVGGRPRGQASRWTLLGTLALGAAPALWSFRRDATAEDRLVRSASATSLAVISASAVAATVVQARHPQGRWGLLVPVSLPAAVAASLAVILVPLRSGLRVVWRKARSE